MKAFTIDNNTIHYRVSGNGNPVVFLHGFLEDHSIWLTIAKHFEKNKCQVILIDLPCHGKSRFVGDNCSMQEMAKLVHGLFKHLTLFNPFVFGHSMGGYVGLELLKLCAIQLTLIHSNFWADAISKKQDRNRVIEIVNINKMRLIQEAIPNLFSLNNRIACGDVMRKLIDSASKLPAAEICAATAGMRDRADNTHLLESESIHIIQGDNDPIIPMSILNEKLAKVSFKQELTIIENCGHMSIWESTAKLINSLNLIVFR